LTVTCHAAEATAVKTLALLSSVLAFTDLALSGLSYWPSARRTHARLGLDASLSAADDGLEHGLKSTLFESALVKTVGFFCCGSVPAHPAVTRARPVLRPRHGIAGPPSLSAPTPFRESPLRGVRVRERRNRWLILGFESYP